MRNRTFIKDIFRSITHSWSRFWAIFAIVALGAGFFAGLRATGTDMRITGDTYFDQTRFMDVELISTLGFTEDDIAAISKTDGIQDVMTSHRIDVISKINDEKKVLRVFGLPDDVSDTNDSYLNRLVLTSGRMPERPGECVIGTSNMQTDSLELGSRITLEDSDGTLGDSIGYTTYTIVGFVNSPYYISFTLGNTTIGNGTISYYIYVPDSDFTQEVYTAVFATVEGAEALPAFSIRYNDTVESVIDSLKTLAGEREQIRYDEVVSEAKEKLAEAEAEYNDAKSEADEKLSDAKQQLDDAQAEIKENEQKLADAKTQLDRNTRKLKDAEAQLALQETQLNSAQQQYNDGAAALQSGWDIYNTNAAELTAQQQQWQRASDDVAAALAALDDAEAAAGGDPVKLGEIAAQRSQLQNTQAQLVLQKTQLDAFAQQLAASKLELEQKAQQLALSKTALDAGLAQLDDAKAQIEDGNAQLKKARRQYNDGVDALRDAKQQLADGIADYEQSKTDAETELADARSEIDDGCEKLDSLEPPEWYVLGRDDNEGYASFDADTGRMDSLSSVFPVLFFLVAALVALTTMTRMVDEERLIIGTYKALGYSDLKIASKYLIYALLASIFGGICGVIIGFRVLPEVCWNAYRLMYTLPDLINEFNIKYAVLGCAAATLCTLAATASVCRSTLASQPAALMLPRAPKSGKRIWLEYVPFIWKRLSFTWKVTFRNLFRYKKRLIMTIVGIAGCSALLLTGFGIKNSISSILDYQYDDICHYDTLIGISDDGISGGAQDILEENFSDWLYTNLHTADIFTQDGGESLSGYIYIPEEAARLGDFLSLHERASKEAIPFGRGSVVLTEKLAKTLGVTEGDQVSIKNTDGKLVSFAVTGVTENYLFHYMYIDPALYREKMDEQPAYNTIVAKCLSTDSEAQRGISDALLDTGDVNTVTYSDDLREKFNDMIKTLNYIVLVLIVSAGALAFVVLYNLTNINVTERRREIATIKVLGFYDRETSAYIYRETSLLTILGCALGLGFGVLMHAFVIQTIEIDNAMNRRPYLIIIQLS